MKTSGTQCYKRVVIKIKLIIAEKFDVAMRICVAFRGISINGKPITQSEYEKKKDYIQKQHKPKRFHDITINNENVRVTWAEGHLCSLKNAEDYDPKYKNWRYLPLPFYPKRYEIKPISTSSEYQLNLIRNNIFKADEIINATDADREGDLIFGYIIQYLGYTNTKAITRMIINSTTDSGLISAYNDRVPYSTRINIEKAGRVRAIADMCVGANLTAALTLKVNSVRGVKSIGRVQTVVLNELVKRTLEIQNFKAEDYWTVKGTFTTQKGDAFVASHTTTKFKNRNDAQTVINPTNGHTGTITKVEKKRNVIPPPELYNLNSLYIVCNQKYKMPAKRTLECAQWLYDNGYTTYPRTESIYLATGMDTKMQDVMAKLKSDTNYTVLIGKADISKLNRSNTRYFKDPDAQHPRSHDAITPTGVVLPDNVNSDYRKVYDLIVRSIIRICYPDAIVEQTKIEIDVSNELFSTSGRVVVSPGWYEISGIPKDALLPAVAEYDKVECRTEIEAKKTMPPRPYTDASLTVMMISAGKSLKDKTLKQILSDEKSPGIGTSATRVNIIETLVKRGYAERNGNSISATPLGIKIIEVLPIEDLKSAEMTAIWEQKIRDIEYGKFDAAKFVNDIHKQTAEWVSEIQKMKSVSIPRASVGNCPKCGAPVYKNKSGYGCSNYVKGCKFFIGKICDKILTESQVKALLSDRKTSKIKGFKSKNGKTFDARLVLDSNNEVKFEFDKSRK